MADVILVPLIYSADRNTNLQYENMDLGRISQDENTIHAPRSGNMRRFYMRVKENNGTGLATLSWFKNGILQPNDVIEISGIGATGSFLPISQLGFSFFADDELVLRWSGLSGGVFPLLTVEWGFDLEFNLV